MDLFLEQNEDTREFDIGIRNDEFVLDDGLQSMVTTSLFCDAREGDNTGDKRGWWGASVLDEDRNGSQFGSKLWLLSREKQLDETLIKIQQWCSDALAWMVDLDIVESVTVTAEYIKTGTVLITVSLIRGDRDPLTFKYKYLWDGQFDVV